MAKRSIQVSSQALKHVRQAFARKGWTQEDLAVEVGLRTRQPVGRFLAGKPVERRIFIELCFQLDLNWEEIANPIKGEGAEQIENVRNNGWEIDTLVEQVRSLYRDKIQEQCGTLRLLDIARRVGVDNIYIDVNILEEITSQRWLEISDLVQGFNPDADEFDRFGLSRVRQARVLGLEAVESYPKLMVLGKPGSGKTTFLKYVAIQCNKGEFQEYRIPIFIRLKNFAEDASDEGSFSLVNYISQELNSCGVSEAIVETLLLQGKALILLDGLDEVQHQNSEEVLKQIRRFSQKYYKNQLIISCRIAAQFPRLPGFTEVEIADLNPEQIESFSKKWFVEVGRSSPPEGLATANRFLEKLKRPENKQIRELAVTPILLNLTCLVFAMKGEFPSKRSNLYEQGLDILLVKRDEAKGIKRNEVYRNLSLPHKIKLLTQVAAITFEQGYYFFEQNKIQQLIADYLRTLPDSQSDPETLRLDSEAVLKSIESQYGLLVERARQIYSFSHLTFQEYLTARQFVASSNPQALEHLVNHVGEKRWREVFLLAAGMLRNADDLLQLMKQKIDAIAASDEKVQELLRCINKKTLSVEYIQQPAAIRAFYFSLACAFDHSLASTLSIGPVSFSFPSVPFFPLPLYLCLAQAIDGDVGMDDDFAYALDFFLNRDASGLNNTDALDRAINRVLDCAIDFALALDSDRARELRRSLQQLKAELPNPDKGLQRFKTWWQAQGQTWTELLSAAIVEHNNASYDWQFSNQQKHLLRQYYDANKLLVDCLNSDCEVTPAVRSHIEDTLLLPIAAIEKLNSL